MATSPNTPTARKGPVTSSPSSKAQQRQRNTSVSKATTKAQQQRKNSNPQTPPKAVMQQRRTSSVAESPTLAGNKRKFATGEQAQTDINLQTKAQGANLGAENADNTAGSLPKKQKTSETKTESTPKPTQTTQMISNLLRHVLSTQPALLPPSPSYPILSSHIDATAHTMWQVAFRHGGMLQSACQYSAMFSPLKLAALAKLNFLPSWWFFREMVVRELPVLLVGGEGGVTGVWVVDDGEMQGVWKEAVRWCIGVKGAEKGEEVGKGMTGGSKVAGGGNMAM